MRRSIVPVVALMIILFGSSCLAAQPAIIGGVRNGAALGLMLESGASNNATLRLGLEANTSHTPVVVFVGGKWFLTNISSRFPMFISGGLVGYMGDRSEAGPYISVVFERFLDVRPLFLEFGVDVVEHGALQFQAGYYF